MQKMPSQLPQMATTNNATMAAKARHGIVALPPYLSDVEFQVLKRRASEHVSEEHCSLLC